MLAEPRVSIGDILVFSWQAVGFRRLAVGILKYIVQVISPFPSESNRKSYLYWPSEITQNSSGCPLHHLLINISATLPVSIFKIHTVLILDHT